MRGRRGSSTRRGPGRFSHFKTQFPETSFWLTAGLRPQSALALTRAGFRSLRDLRGVSREALQAIPGVGPATLMTLEGLLGGEVSPPRPSGIPRPLLPEEVWRRRGIPSEAAITFAQLGMTLERLQVMTREELLGLRAVGPRTLRACERLLGREIPSRKPSDPAETFWRSRGVSARAARALSKAGIGTLEALEVLFCEDVLALPGVGTVELRRLEAVTGREIPSRTAYWTGRGLHFGMANVLVRNRLFTLAEVGALSREQFLSRPGLGVHALRKCEHLLGRELASPRQYWQESGFPRALAQKLARAGIQSLADLCAVDSATLRSHGLNGFEIRLCALVSAAAR